MTRIVSRGAMAGGVTLVALWLIFARHEPAPAAVSTVLTPPLANRAHDSLAPDTTEPRELALFQVIVRARQAAVQEARTLVPLPESGRLPFAPSVVSRKGGGNRDLEASRRTAKKLADIAFAHGITLEELEDIDRRGEAEGWPTTP